MCVYELECSNPMHFSLRGRLRSRWCSSLSTFHDARTIVKSLNVLMPLKMNSEQGRLNSGTFLTQKTFSGFSFSCSRESWVHLFIALTLYLLLIFQANLKKSSCRVSYWKWEGISFFIFWCVVWTGSLVSGILISQKLELVFILATFRRNSLRSKVVGAERWRKVATHLHFKFFEPAFVLDASKTYADPKNKLLYFEWLPSTSYTFFSSTSSYPLRVYFLIDFYSLFSVGFTWNSQNKISEKQDKQSKLNKNSFSISSFALEVFYSCPLTSAKSEQLKVVRKMY